MAGSLGRNIQIEVRHFYYNCKTEEEPMSILSKQEIKEAKKNMELADKCCKNLSAIVLTKKQKEQEINRIYQVRKFHNS